MGVHQLAIFWRDERARSFTAWHFQPAPQERAAHRAAKILSAAMQLSTLQIYGAVLDTAQLRFEAAPFVPARGIDTRLEASLMPTAKSKVGSGQLKFSIPGPSSALYSAVTAQQFSSPEWQLLEQEVIPYLCSPSGVKASVSPDRLLKAEIVTLPESPLPGQAPIDAALARTQEAVEAAKLRYQQLLTPKLKERIAKYQARLELLEKWRESEAALFSKVEELPSVTRPLIIERKEEIMTEQKISTPADSPLLPTIPASEEADLWTDVPQTHFSILQMWTHRIEIRQLYGLNERTYYRWVNSLKEYGLSRSRPAQGNARVTLFYRPDLERALEAAESARRPVKARPISSTAQMPQTATVQLGFAASQLASLANMAADLSTQQKALAAAFSRLEAGLIEQRQADLSEINQQLAKLAQQQAEMAAQLPQGHFLDLIAQLVNLNQLPNLLKKLNSNLQKLVNPKTKTAAKAKAKTPAKKKAKTAAKAKAKPSVKKKPRSSSAEIKRARKHSGD
jgi:hypothetical protein